MPDLSAFKQDSRFFVLMVGESGSGKSAAAHSFPKPSHELDFDLRVAGIAAAANQGWLKGDGISYTQFSPLQGWNPVINFMEIWDVHNTTGRFPFKTVSVGSLFTLSRLILNHSILHQGGRVLGATGGKHGIRIVGPADINVEANATHAFFDHLRTYPANVLVSAHVVDKWGKPSATPNMTPAEKESLAYAANVVVGEKLSVRDNLGEHVQSYFDNVWRFSREMVGANLKFYVEFQTSIAKNSFGIPVGKHDITSKEFYPLLLELIEKYKKVAPKAVTP